MVPKYAVLQVADTGPLESLAIMFRAIGITPVLPNDALRWLLRQYGLDTVLSPRDLVNDMGYDWPMPLDEVGPEVLHHQDIIYVDVKAHRNGPLLWPAFPGLKTRTLWYRINGGEPEHVIKDGKSLGDEVSPPCPVVTPNRWYGDGIVEVTPRSQISGIRTYKSCPSYGFWPAFVRAADYAPCQKERMYLGGALRPFSPPICLIHNVEGWGYQRLIPAVDEMGVRIYGRSSPGGLIDHREVGPLLSSALAMVHLKSNDAPGYALYEAVYAGCPVILPRRLIWRCRMDELWEEGVTCLTFDRETHDHLTDDDVKSCADEIRGHLDALRKDPDMGRRMAGRALRQLLNLSWNPQDRIHVESFRQFIHTHFGGPQP